MSGATTGDELHHMHSKLVFPASVRLLSRENGGLGGWFLLERRGVGVRKWKRISHRNVNKRNREWGELLP